MKTTNLLADISLCFFNQNKVYKYRMKKVSEMNDDELIQFCHWYCEENNLTKEFNKMRKEVESQHCYCEYLHEYIEYGQCCDMQMVSHGYVKDNILDIRRIDKEKLNLCCNNCEYVL